jgi:hypothetical protein
MPVCEPVIVILEAAPDGLANSAFEEFHERVEFVKFEQPFFAVGKDFGTLERSFVLEVVF